MLQGPCRGCQRVQLLGARGLCGACSREAERRTYTCPRCRRELPSGSVPQHHRKDSAEGRAHLPDRLRRIEDARRGGEV